VRFCAGFLVHVHVGVLSTSYPRDRHDWAGHFVRGFARWLHASGHRVTVVCAGSEGRRRTDEGGIEVVRVPGRGLFYRGGAPEALAKRMPWAGAAPFVLELGVRAWLARRVDAWVSHWLVPCGVLGCLLAGRRPHLAVAHSGDVHLLERLHATPAMARLLARRDARVAFSSGPLRDRLLLRARAADRERLLARSAVVPMGIDVEQLRARAPRVRRPGRLVAAFLGRRSPIKGLDVLERAAAGLPGVELRIADGGVVGEDKRALLEAADVLVVPSVELGDGRTEGTPTAVLEGMAAGLPVVASRTGGIPDVVREGETGLLVTPGDAAELRGALVRLRDDVPLRARLAEAARFEAAGHDWSRVGPKLAALL
jgi:glycosyltransferase involved in cell wall biosynthesis